MSKKVDNKTLPSEAETLNYRWIVLVCSFLTRFLVFGSVMSVGVLYVEWLDEFEMGLGNTALVGSIATGSVLLMGPISGALLDRFTCKQIITVFGIFMSVGLIVSSFSNSISFLCLSFGVVTGCAGGVINLASIVSLNQYFYKQRPLAMGVGSGGVGVGIFAFGFLQKYFVQLYTWKGSLLLLGAIQLHMVVCGLLMVHPDQLKKHTFFWNWRSKRKNSLSRPSQMNQKKNKSRSSIDEEQKHTGITDTSDGEKIVVNESLLSIHCDKHNDDDLNECIKSHNRLRKRRSTFQVIKAKIRLTQTTIDLWKNPTFIMLFWSDFLSWLVQFVPYVHLPERATLLGIENGSLFVSLMGISSAFGKVAFGAICTFLHLCPFKVFVVAQTLFGLSTILSPLCLSFWSLCVFSVSFGFLSGSYSLMMVIPARLLGEEKFSLAYGFMLAGEGVGVYLGPPLVGWITDATSSYDSSFYLAGGTLLLSALLLMIRPLAMKLKRRNAKIPKQSSIITTGTI